MRDEGRREAQAIAERAMREAERAWEQRKREAEREKMAAIEQSQREVALPRVIDIPALISRSATLVDVSCVDSQKEEAIAEAEDKRMVCVCAWKGCGD